MYTSVDNEKIKDLKKLAQKKYRQDLFLIEGKKIIEEANKKKLIKELYVLEGKKIDLKLELNYINLKVAKYLSNLETSDYLFALCQKAEKKEIRNRVLFLDGVQDPGNVGTIIRSAVAFNIDTIILRNCCDVYNDKVIRSSMGMIFHINLIEVSDYNLMIELKKSHQLIGTDANAKKSLKDLVIKSKFVIIMGSEGRGIEKELLDLCDEMISIPIKDNCESLNVAIATSIILYKVGDL